ncbi:MAG: hypothetical protein RJA98_1099 [Pseudomonadota bacterium]|jgi:selenide,water dikinase
MKRLVLVGAGRAHLQLLATLAQQPLPAVQVALVSPHAQALYANRLTGRMAAGAEPAPAVHIALAKLAHAAKVAFIDASVQALDPDAHTLTLSDGTQLDHDTLSLNTGAVADRDAIPGARENALFARPVEHLLRLWDGVVALAQQQAVSLVVVGGGASGVELALAAQHRLGERARVSLLTGGGPLLASHTPALQQRVAQVLRARRIQVFHERCVAVQPGQVQLASGTRLACDVPLIATTPVAPAWLAGSGLALDDAGFVATTATLQSCSHPDVFAAGDVAGVRGGAWAERAGPPLALNLRRFVAGGALEPWAPSAREPLTLLSDGATRAIGAWGPLAFDAAWLGRWKHRRDARFVADFPHDTGAAIGSSSSAGAGAGAGAAPAD